jgi:Lon protease-like protein
MATPRSPSIVLPLFPLHAVLFPGGLLSLKVFEPRYLDLMSTCLRERQPFGVVLIRQGSEVLAKPLPRQGGERAAVSFESVGVVAELVDVDAAQANILRVRCRGLQRFDLRESRQESDGLWKARVRTIPDDEDVLPSEALVDTARALASAMAALKQQGSDPFLKPFHFENAGWVANRWCEILPIPVAARQRLMELTDPLVRLKLVAEFLRGKGVVR